VQWDPETMDWEEWPPFISPLGCMGWLFSIPGPANGHANANSSVRHRPSRGDCPLPRQGARGRTGPSARAARRGRTLPMGPRLGAELELCCAGCPTSWLTEGSLLIPPPWTLFMGERTGP